MRASTLFVRTAKETPHDAEAAADRLLRRGGFLQRLGPGLPAGSPLLARALRNLERTALGRLESAGAQEITLPAVHPEPESADRFRAADPLHSALALVKRTTESHRHFPLALVAFVPVLARPERPGPGLLRLVETPRAVAVGLALDAPGERRLLARLVSAGSEVAQAAGLAPLTALAGYGAAPDAALTLAVPCEAGETELLRCGECRTAFLRTSAPAPPPPADFIDYGRPMETIPTPAIRSVEELVRFTGIPAHQMVKTILCRVESAEGVCFAACLMRGDLEISLPKLAHALGADRAELAAADDVTRLTGAAVGFAGPFGLPPEVRVLADPSAAACRDFLCGVNRTDYHNIQVRFGRDLPLPETADLRLAAEGEACPACGGGTLALLRALPLGVGTSLGTFPAEGAGLRITDPAGASVPPRAVRFDLDLAAILSAAVETRRDTKGPILSPAVAPFPVVVIPTTADPAACRAAELAYDALRRAGIGVLLDDREASAGAKFADAALFGAPLLVIAGKTWAAEEKFELEARGGAKTKAPMDGLVDAAAAALDLFESVDEPSEVGAPPRTPLKGLKDP